MDEIQLVGGLYFTDAQILLRQAEAALAASALLKAAMAAEQMEARDLAFVQRAGAGAVGRRRTRLGDSPVGRAIAQHG